MENSEGRKSSNDGKSLLGFRTIVSLRLQLSREGHSEPIAWYQGTKRYQIDGKYQWGSAYLALEPEGEKMRDTIVISLIAYQQKVKLWRGIGLYGPVLS